MLGLLEQSVVLCKQGVAGSIPVTSTNLLPAISITCCSTCAGFGKFRNIREQ